MVRDKYPAYISWETFERIQHMLRDNHAEYDRNKTRGVPRDGQALLHGILYCGECGHKLCVQYKGGTTVSLQPPAATTRRAGLSVAAGRADRRASRAMVLRGALRSFHRSVGTDAGRGGCTTRTTLRRAASAGATATLCRAVRRATVSARRSGEPLDRGGTRTTLGSGAGRVAGGGRATDA